jgi:probable F420-dependent oxidoreductase
MRFGLVLPNYARWFDADGAREAADAAERLGYHGIYVNDHVALPREEAPLYGNAFLDPYVALGFLAAVTERVRLGTTIIVLPYRNPIVQAKMVAGLDVLSKGRITLGVGSGHVPGESAALGVPYAERGAMTDEYLRVMRTLWTEDEAEFHGRWFNFAHICPLTRPVQAPLPVWIGGRGPRVLRRVVALGQGWHPTRMAPEEIEAEIGRLRAMAAAAGRTEPITVAMRWSLHLVERAEEAGPGRDRGEIQRTRRTPAETAALVERYAAAGVDELLLDLPGGHAAFLQQVEWFAREVMPAAPPAHAGY